jgi:cellulose synthase/poly-beta-1,6-N-acetylglucosamine synthase-like glycosyltransferase
MKESTPPSAGQKTLPFVTIIIPTRNSDALLVQALQSIRALDYPKDRIELIIPDGMSTDRSRAIAAEYGAQVIENPGKTIGAARDTGFGASRGELIAFTDADCLVDPGWIRNAINYFEDPQVGAIGGPSPAPDDQKAFGSAVRAFFRLAYLLARTGHVEQVAAVENVEHIPGCNLICRASALRKIFPLRWKTTSGEDIETGRLLMEHGYTLLHVPDVRVLHYKRTTVRSFFWQMQSYARGRLHVARKNWRWIKPAHVLCGFALPIGLLVLLMGMLWHPTAVLVVMAILLGSTVIVARTLGTTAKIPMKGALLFPAILIIGITGWSWGFITESLSMMKWWAMLQNARNLYVVSSQTQRSSSRQ